MKLGKHNPGAGWLDDACVGSQVGAQGRPLPPCPLLAAAASSSFSWSETSESTYVELKSAVCFYVNYVYELLKLMGVCDTQVYCILLCFMYIDNDLM